MADNTDQNSPWDAMYNKGKAIASQLAPEHLQTLLSTFLGGGGQQPTASKEPKALGSQMGSIAGVLGASPDTGTQYGPYDSLGTAATDPAPAAQDMVALGRTPATVPFAPPNPSSAKVSRGILGIGRPQLDRSAVDPALDSQSSDIDKIRAIADQKQAAVQGPNLRSIAAYVDATTGSHFSQSYQSPDEKLTEVAKLRSMAAAGDNSFSKLQAQIALGQQRNDGLAIRALATQQAKIDKANNPSLDPKVLDTDTQKLSKDFNSYKDARDQIANIAGTSVRSSHLAALMDRYKSGDELKPTELRELGTGVAAMLVNGSSNGTIAQGQIDELAPAGFNKSAASAASWIESHPENANMGKWVELLGNTVHSQAATSELQLHAIRQRILGGYRSLYDDSRGRKNVYNIARQWGVSKKEVDEAYNDSAPDNANFQELPYAGSSGGFYTGTIVPGAVANQKALNGPVVNIHPDIHQAAIDYVKAHPGHEGDKTRANLDKQGIKY